MIVRTNPLPSWNEGASKRSIPHFVEAVTSAGGAMFRDGQVSVAVLAPPNIAVGIRSRARVVKEEMETAEHLAVVEIDVREVKNDMMRRGVIESGVAFAPPEDVKDYYVGAIAEIEDM